LFHNHVSGAPVVEEGRVVGVISEADIIRALWPRRPGDARTSILSLLLGRERGVAPARSVARVQDAMSTPPVTGPASLSVYQAASLMDRKGIKRLPVTDREGFLLGIVSRGDLVRVMADDHIPRGRQERDSWAAGYP
jgi:CBS domain-containing protein